MSDEYRSLDVLIQEMLDGVLDEDQRENLLKRVEADSDARKRYLDQIATHTALKAVLADCLPQRVGVPTAVDAVGRSAVVLKSRWSTVAAIASTAVTIVFLASGVGYLWFNSQNPPIAQSDGTQHVAVVTQSVGAYDSDGVAIRPGQNVESGGLSVDRGVARLDFVSGATIAVEGPAEIEVVDEMRVVLLRGVVTATIPESAIGFVIDTDAAHVVDLGTSFGVSVGDTGLTDVCVFEGEVEVSSPQTNRPDATPHLLREGEAIRASKEFTSINSVAYDASQFENAWPVNSGVLQTTGSMRFVSPGPDFHPGNYEDNEHIVVFPERRGFVPRETIRVDMVDPGEYAKSDYRQKPELPPGKRLTSYLLQLDAYPEGKNPNRRRSVRGQITFANPIAGVITMNRLLKESEAIFGMPDVSYPSPRTIEPRPEGDQRPGFDSLILAADRRTLFIELQENPGHLDQVRVLVEAE